MTDKLNMARGRAIKFVVVSLLSLCYPLAEMRTIESKPIPLKLKGLTGDLKRLRQPTDSFLIENKGLNRASLYATASRLGIRIITQVENDGLRVWRNFEGEAVKD